MPVNQHSNQLASVSSTPLAAATSGRLIFTSGATGVMIQSDPGLRELYQGRFVRFTPGVHVEYDPAGLGQCNVTLHYRQPVLGNCLVAREPLAVITLNESIPWEIEFHGGVAQLLADLRGLRLRSLDLRDSSGVNLLLAKPTGNVYLYVSGSASDVVIQRPVGVALHVQIAGSASQVRIDAYSFSAVANGIHWQTSDYYAAADRYDIRFAGSVSHVTIGCV